MNICLCAKATTGVEAGGQRLELKLFSHIQGVVHLNSEYRTVLSNLVWPRRSWTARSY